MMARKHRSRAGRRSLDSLSHFIAELRSSKQKASEDGGGEESRLAPDGGASPSSSSSASESESDSGQEASSGSAGDGQGGPRGIRGSENSKAEGSSTDTRDEESSAGVARPSLKVKLARKWSKFAGSQAGDGARSENLWGDLQGNLFGSTPKSTEPTKKKKKKLMKGAGQNLRNTVDRAHAEVGQVAQAAAMLMPPPPPRPPRAPSIRAGEAETQRSQVRSKVEGSDPSPRQEPKGTRKAKQQNSAPGVRTTQGVVQGPKGPSVQGSPSKAGSMGLRLVHALGVPPEVEDSFFKELLHMARVRSLEQGIAAQAEQFILARRALVADFCSEAVRLHSAAPLELVAFKEAPRILPVPSLSHDPATAEAVLGFYSDPQRLSRLVSLLQRGETQGNALASLCSSAAAMDSLQRRLEEDSRPSTTSMALEHARKIVPLTVLLDLNKALRCLGDIPGT